MNPQLLRWTCGLVGFSLAALGTSGFPAVALVLATAAGVCLLGASVTAFRQWRLRTDPYSLAALHRLDDEPAPLAEETDLGEAEQVLCPGCYQAYGGWLPVCPHCGRANG